MFHSGSRAGLRIPARLTAKLAENSKSCSSDMTEPKGERMNLPQWDGDPSGWRDSQQEVRLCKTGDNLEVNWSIAERDWLVA